MNKQLLIELTELRDKYAEKLPEDKTPDEVCSDRCLEELARLKPITEEELLYIKGLGQPFVDKYGKAFIKVITRHQSKNVKSKLLGREVKETLRNLENRLVNINRRNRLLFMPKLSSNMTCDLVRDSSTQKGADFNANLLEFIKKFTPNKKYTICDITEGDSMVYFNRLTKLLREDERTVRETGENNLYIGYPFVIGKLVGEEFSIRAPLVLFPVQLVKESSSFTIKMDTTKDIMYNASLLLSVLKFNNTAYENLPSTIVEEVAYYTFNNQIIDYYNENGLLIKQKEEKLKPFVEYETKEFPKFKRGECYLEENIVIGKFPIYSSSLQKDFKAISQEKNINELLNNLLQRYDDVDFYSESIDLSGKGDVKFGEEKNLNYINDLNMSQEQAIFTIDHGSRLVVQGPPGTGKSQTITSMISDFVNKGQNVLMVSQKKAALDVIHSRLGKLNKYSLFIHDVKNKDMFYDQLFNIVTDESESSYNNAEFDSISEKIDSNIERLDALAEKLYYDQRFGVGMYKIYEESHKSEVRREDAGVFTMFADSVPTELYTMGYPAIKDCERFFKDRFTVEFCKEYYDLMGVYPWLNDVSKGYTQIQIQSILLELDHIIDLYVENKSRARTMQPFTLGKYKSTLKEFMDIHFSSYSVKLFNDFIKNPLLIYNGFKAYPDFFSNKVRYDELLDEHKLFFESAYTISQNLKADVNAVINRYSGVCALKYIDEFESANRDAFVTLDNFNGVVDQVTKMLERKKDLSKDRMRDTLVKANRGSILDSKRKGDIVRVIDGKNKWDIARFIKKFRLELFNGIKIWLMTPEVVSEVMPLENGLFDLVIFDEASQIYIEKGVPSIARAKKIVVAGDHKQLRPSSLGVGRMDYEDDGGDDFELNAALEEESLLDLARFKFPEVLLNYHYRSKYEELIAFSNYAFYKGRLNVSPNTDKPSSPPIEISYVDDGIWEDRINRAEADRVVELIKKNLYNSKANQTMGVITFNSAQRDLILDKLDALCAQDSKFAAKYTAETRREENGEDVGLFVKNIENVQGDERDMIIFSLAYAKNNQGKMTRNFGWLNQAGGENRLNVAISRAKEKIIIVSSIHPSDLKVDDLLNEGPRIFKKYLEYAFFISDGNIDAAREVLFSFGHRGTTTTEYNDEFTLIVAKKLMEAGLNIERNVGIGGYKIDMAVKDSGGKYLLGIECDCNLFMHSENARERDIHRAKYLTSRGWKLHRIWSSNWWRSAEREVEKVKAKLY